MPSLKENIAAYNAELGKNMPEEIASVMMQATDELKQSGIEDRSLKSGDTVPDFELPDQNGVQRRFSDYLASSPVVLNIYRGGWCPYCNMEMKALHDALPQIEAQGAQLVGLSPETPDHAMETADRNEIKIDILSDAGNQVSERMGLVFELSEALRPVYEKFGLDIPGYNGDDSFKLPVPATYIIGQDGKILYHFVNADYTQRQEPSDIVSMLANLN